MCGINGIYHLNNQPVDQYVLESMRDIMEHRGPDGHGYFIDHNIGLGHRRLSILDLSENGKQPFASEDGRYRITFNGEVYNFNDLKP